MMNSIQQQIDEDNAKAIKCHRIWHKFSNWLEQNFGKDLFGEMVPHVFKGANGERIVFNYKPFNEIEFNRRIVGIDVMRKIEKYVKRYCPEIKIVKCDDDTYSSSIILLIPHPAHGISVMFVPQNTMIQNRFFLYDGHFTALTKALNDMKYVYGEDVSDAQKVK